MSAVESQSRRKKWHDSDKILSNIVKRKVLRKWQSLARGRRDEKVEKVPRREQFRKKVVEQQNSAPKPDINIFSKLLFNLAYRNLTTSVGNITPGKRQYRILPNKGLKSVVILE